MHRLRRRHTAREAISPVIATVIIVAVTIAVAISAAFWLGGLSALFTRFERFEIPTAFPTGSAPAYNITMIGKNTGTADASITDIIVKDRPIGAFDTGNFSVRLIVTPPGGSAITTRFYRSCTGACATGGGKTYALGGLTVAVVTGASFTINVVFTSSAPLTSGVALELRVLTSGGQEYGKSVSLP